MYLRRIAIASVTRCNRGRRLGCCHCYRGIRDFDEFLVQEQRDHTVDGKVLLLISLQPFLIRNK